MFAETPTTQPARSLKIERSVLKAIRCVRSLFLFVVNQKPRLLVLKVFVAVARDGENALQRFAHRGALHVLAIAGELLVDCGHQLVLVARQRHRRHNSAEFRNDKIEAAVYEVAEIVQQLRVGL